MAATSVTGRGLGISNGLYKPELHCGGCGCGKSNTPVDPPEKIKLGCVTRIKSSNKIKSIANNGKIASHGC